MGPLSSEHLCWETIQPKISCNFPFSRFVVSGTYGNYLKIHDRTTGRGVMLDSNFSSSDRNNKIHSKGKHSFGSKSKVKEEVKLDSLDFKKKLLHAAWRPNETQLTNAVGKNLVFLQGRIAIPELIWASIYAWNNRSFTTKLPDPGRQNCRQCSTKSMYL